MNEIMIKNSESAILKLENVFMKKRSSIEDLDLDWQQTLDNKMADFKPKGTAIA